MSQNLTEHRDLLVEIGTEELPPKALLRLAESFCWHMVQGLRDAQIRHFNVPTQPVVESARDYEKTISQSPHLINDPDINMGVRYYATPRRLAVMIKDVAIQQRDRPIERRGPALNAAFDDNNLPTKATQGFARSCGVEVEQLEKLETDKGAWLVFRSTQIGCATAKLLPAIIEQSLAALPIPKRMRWGSSRVEFVRPVHWVVLLFGDDVIDTEILGVRTGRETHGHRFHHPASMYITKPTDYASLLKDEGHVLPDFAVRRDKIREQIIKVATSFGGTAVIDDTLLDEVTGLVEWPVALIGQFEERFLNVPQEALISTMKGNQKYFHAVAAPGILPLAALAEPFASALPCAADGNSKLLPYFITISNIESRDPDKVREGNERVIRPRFTDAAFFWEQDCKHPLLSRLEQLKSVVFEEKLGTLYDKTMRIKHLTHAIIEMLGDTLLFKSAKENAERAAELCKCDLLTSMVSEFPELQGVMGRYYATRDGNDSQVAIAIEEHYLPRHAGDALPQSIPGQIVAIADRLDTLVGIFAISQEPSGDKDPYALRRAALGTLRIIIESKLKLDLDLYQLLITAMANLPNTLKKDSTAPQVFNFMMERLRGYYHEQGIRPDVFEAVLANRPTRPSDFNQRIHAVSAFRALPEAESLAAANKRIRNILNKTSETIPSTVNETLLSEPAEHDLFKKVTELHKEVIVRFENRNYEGAMKLLASLREPVDTFFDKIMVMADDAALRANRLALLKQLGDLMNHVADISKLAAT